MKTIASNGMEINTGDAVLIRNHVQEVWKYSLFSHRRNCDYFPFMTINTSCVYCIPYRGNEDLVGTNTNFVMSKKENKFLSYEEKQEQWVKKYNIKVGDKVRITKKCDSHENGWDNQWLSEMNDSVGKIGTITSIGSSIFISINNSHNYFYPYHILEKVEDTIKFNFGARVRGYDKKAKKEKIGILIDQHPNKYARYRVAYPLNDEEGETDWFPNIEYLVHK